MSIMGSEMVERVAVAIEETMFAEHEFPLDIELHNKYLSTARAAIAAMREPTPEMIKKAEYGAPYVEDIWRAMIDEALK